MKLEQQVCSLELAKKLKELGVKQESLFYWEQCITGIHKDKYKDGGFALVYKNERQLKDIANISAFTVAELGEMLPDDIKIKDTLYFLGTQKTCSTWWVFYSVAEHKKLYKEFRADTEADARAKMLIYLLENNLITIRYGNRNTNKK